MDFGNLSYLVEMYCKQYLNNKRLKKRPIDYVDTPVVLGTPAPIVMFY